MSDDILNRAPSHEHGEQAESTLLPMLIGGLAMIIVGAVFVMNFV